MGDSGAVTGLLVALGGLLVFFLREVVKRHFEGLDEIKKKNTSLESRLDTVESGYVETLKRLEDEVEARRLAEEERDTVKLENQELARRLNELYQKQSEMTERLERLESDRAEQASKHARELKIERDLRQKIEAERDQMVSEINDLRSKVTILEAQVSKLNKDAE